MVLDFEIGMGYVRCMTTSYTLPELTNELLGDLLDPAMGPIDICAKYALSIPQLRALVRTEEYKELRDAVVEIAEARFSLQLPRARQTALDQLTRITAVNPITPQHAETVRKAVGMILRWKPAPLPARDEPARHDEASSIPATSSSPHTDRRSDPLPDDAGHGPARIDHEPQRRVKPHRTPSADHVPRAESVSSS